MDQENQESPLAKLWDLSLAAQDQMMRDMLASTATPIVPCLPGQCDCMCWDKYGNKVCGFDDKHNS